MAKAIVDPAELRRFAHMLKQFNTDLEQRMTALHGQMTGLAQTWRDQEQRKFTEEFEQTMRAMSRFIDASNQYVPFLLRKAERVDDYLQQR